MEQKIKPIDHSKRDHALLSASGASRWMNCTPSAVLEDKLGPSESSPYAAEGTLAHEICEITVRRDIKKSITEDEADELLERIMSNELFNSEMLDYAQMYAEYCGASYIEASQNDELADIYVEQKLDLTSVVPESFGTADCVIVGTKMMEIIDYKYGKGVPVYAQYNPQLMLYGIGAIEKFGLLYDIDLIRLTIIQPRINNISSWDISKDDLLKWAEDEVKPAAKLAFAGEGEFVSGSWCKFCRLKGQCRAIAEKNLQIAKHDFAKPSMLSNDEIADILGKAKDFTDWLSSVEEFALKEAISGTTYKGYKLVKGTSRRKWFSTDEDEVANEILAAVPELSEDQIFDMKLKGITDMEKLIGKKRFGKILSEIVVKPEGKPTLVPADDSRLAMGIEDAVNDFK